jgi:hypothetical protein
MASHRWWLHGLSVLTNFNIHMYLYLDIDIKYGKTTDQKVVRMSMTLSSYEYNNVETNVRQYRKGNRKWTIQRNWQHRVHKTKKNKTKTQHTMCYENCYQRSQQVVHIIYKPVLEIHYVLSKYQVYVSQSYCLLLTFQC